MATRARAGLRRARERGSATAELAVALPAVALVLLAVIATAVVGVAQLRCADGARAGARSAALGASAAEAGAAAAHAAGEGAEVAVDSVGGWVHVTVSRSVPMPFGGVIRVSARAAAPAEPGGSG